MRPVSANMLSTVEVHSPAGENVGKVVDFMLDTERGSVCLRRLRRWRCPRRRREDARNTAPGADV